MKTISLQIPIPEFNAKQIKDGVKTTMKTAKCTCAAGLFAIALKLGNGCEMEFYDTMEESEENR
jgi:hypothetical protein